MLWLKNFTLILGELSICGFVVNSIIGQIRLICMVI